MFSTIIAGFSGIFGAIGSAFTWLTQRGAQNNTPDMQNSQEAKDDINTSNNLNNIIANGDENAIRNILGS